MGIKISFLPEVRLHSPYWQNVIMGVILGLSAGLYEALNLLGAGGGRPNSFKVVQADNATLCAVWVFSSAFGGTVLNTIGPAISSFIGVFGYAAYVAGLWYFDQTGESWFPITGSVAVGLSAGLIFVVMGSISMSYSEEQERGSFITMMINLQAVGAAVGGLIPLIINRNSQEVAGVPTAVYIVILAMMACAGALSFALRPASKIIRDDGTYVATLHSRGFVEELKSNLEVFKDWKLMLMIPAFLPSECFFVYTGSINAFHNDLRTRSLLSFIAVVLQIPCGYGLQKILDHKIWHRRSRALVALAVIGIPLVASWIWQIVEVRNYDRSNPPLHTTDWNDTKFVATFFLFMLTFVSSIIFQYVVIYMLGCLTNSPRKAANYSGVFRSFLAAGEAICFGLDSNAISYLKESSVIFVFYSVGLIIFVYLATFHIKETEYFMSEEGVVIPIHVADEHVLEAKQGSEPQITSHGAERHTVPGKMAEAAVHKSS